MKNELTEKLQSLFSELSSPNSEFMQLAESCLDDEFLVEFTTNIMNASRNIKDALSIVEDHGQSISESDIDEIGAIAQAFDESGDELLQKQASVLDEILMSIGADPKAQVAFKKAEDSEVERLRAKYRAERREQAYASVNPELEKQIGAEQAIKEIEKKVKTYRPLEASLSSRYSPDMPGVSLMRIGENIYQCPVTKKIYDFNSGYTTAKGNKIPGTGVQGQTEFEQVGQEHMEFSSREQILNGS